MKIEDTIKQRLGEKGWKSIKKGKYKVGVYKNLKNPVGDELISLKKRENKKLGVLKRVFWRCP